MPYLEWAGKLISNVKGLYTDMNPATLTGAIDVVVVKQLDGSFLSSPWHVRFGKLGILWANENVVDVEINGRVVAVPMRLGEAGEAYFLQEVTDQPDSQDNNNNNNNNNNNIVENKKHENSNNKNKDSVLVDTKQVRNTSNSPVEIKQFDFTPESADNTNEKSATPTSTDTETCIETHAHTDTHTEATIETCTQQETNLKRHKSIEESLFDLELDSSPTTTTTTTTNNNNTTTSDVVFFDTTADANKIIPFYNSNNNNNNIPNNSNIPNNNNILNNNKMKRQQTFQHLYKHTDVQGIMIRCNSCPEVHNNTTINIYNENNDENSFDCVSPECIVGSLPKDYMTQQGNDNGQINDVTDCIDWKWGQLPEKATPILAGNAFDDMAILKMGTPKRMDIKDLGVDVGSVGGSDVGVGGSDVGVCGSDVGVGGSDVGVGSKDEVEKEKEHEEKDVKKDEKDGKKNGEKKKKGIYLDDLNDEDPELVKLYIYNNFPPTTTTPTSHSLAHKNSSTSHQSPFSLPESPVSFDQTIPSLHRTRARSCCADDKNVEHNSSSDFKSLIGQNSTTDTPTTTSLTTLTTLATYVSLSLCGTLDDTAEDAKEEKFNKSMVTYEQFSSNTTLLNHPSLIIKIDQNYYRWSVAAPMLISQLAFKQNLPQVCKDKLIKHSSSRKEGRRGWLGGWFSGGTKEKPTIKLPNKDDQGAEEKVDGSNDGGGGNISSGSGNDGDGSDNSGGGYDGTGSGGNDGGNDIRHSYLLRSQTVSESNAETIPIAMYSSEEDKKVALDVSMLKSGKYCKSLKLTSEQLAQLKLLDGVNEASFSITTKYQGTTKVHCSIFLWKSSDKVVVSDIDGTITKSDVLGQIFPIMGQVSPLFALDWSQLGIANLYTLVHQNGYRFIYLSARAIGQSTITRDYLRELRQAEYKLPVGPLFLSPSSLRSAFHKEVIERKPEEFKIKCLRNIRAIFPNNHNPFTAGFGNRINDVWAYTAAGIPKARIFIVNPKGQLSIERTSFQSSYCRLSDLVDHMFPSFALDSEYGAFNYWRDATNTQQHVCENEVENFLEKYRKKSRRKSRKPSEKTLEPLKNITSVNDNSKDSSLK